MICYNKLICPKCGGSLKYYDKVKRKEKLGQNKTIEINIRRFKCTRCGSVHRELPIFLLPYKQYSINVIKDVLSGSNDIRYEDYPCETTIKRWSAQDLQLLL